MKHLVTILFLISCFNCYGQGRDFKLFVNYQYLVTPEVTPIKINYNSTLTANSKKSIYEIKLKTDKATEVSSDKGSFTMLPVSSNSFYYKDLDKNILLNKESVSTKKFVVHDRLDVFDWNMKSETKNILGYKCQQATAHFRGRDYVAYFTTAIPIQNGPWKFHGLPGLILEVYSTDGMFKIIANELTFEAGKVAITNPYVDAKPIPYAEYVKLYNKKYEETLSYRGEGGVTMSIPKKKIEVLVQD